MHVGPQQNQVIAINVAGCARVISINDCSAAIDRSALVLGTRFVFALKFMSFGTQESCKQLLVVKQ
jgi:hypothetical protein